MHNFIHITCHGEFLAAGCTCLLPSSVQIAAVQLDLNVYVIFVRVFYLCEPKFDSPLFKGTGKLFKLFQVTWLLGMRGHRSHCIDAALHDLLPLLEKYRSSEPGNNFVHCACIQN